MSIITSLKTVIKQQKRDGYNNMFSSSAHTLGMPSVANLGHLILITYPNVYISESDLIPGYLKKSHVPPMFDLLSKIL